MPATAVGTTIELVANMQDVRLCASPRPSVTPPYSLQRRSPGFSLIELLIVVAISIVFTTMAVVQVRGALVQHRLQESASMISGKLMEARMNALKRNRPTWLLIDVATGTVQVQATGAGGAAQSLGVPGRLSQGIAFSEVPAQIDYDPLGRLAAAEALTVVHESGFARTINIAVSGTATIQ